MFHAHLLRVGETALVVLGFWVSHLYHYGSNSVLPEAALVALATVGLFHVVYTELGMYDVLRRRRLSAEFVRMLGCWLLIVSGAGLFAFLTKFGLVVSRMWFISGVALSFASVCIFRTSVHAALGRAREYGFGSRSIVLVGSTRGCRDVTRKLRENSWVGVAPVAVFNDEDDAERTGVADVPVMGSVSGVYGFVEQQRRCGVPIDQVWILLNDFDEETIFSLVERMEDSSVDLRLIPNFLGLKLARDMIDEVGDIPLINLSEVRKGNVCETAKRAFDLSVATASLIVLGPLMVGISLLIKYDSPGPVIFRQQRYGIEGREILIFKFRTMVWSGEDLSVVQARRNDCRVTRVGRVLRRTSLDELPQLFNVLQGSMSIVGPRPHAVIHNEFYRARIKGYMGRHKVKPGITGWAQVNGLRGETETLAKMEERVRLDIEYIRNWSMLFDLRIIFMTAFHCLFNQEAY